MKNILYTKEGIHEHAKRVGMRPYNLGCSCAECNGEFEQMLNEIDKQLAEVEYIKDDGLSDVAVFTDSVGKLPNARLAAIDESVYAKIADLDAAIDVEVPETDIHYPTTSDINRLMELMAEGQHKIEAIKYHCKITGWGLKESKDQVERCWVAADPKPLSPEGNIIGDDILAIATRYNNCY